MKTRLEKDMLGDVLVPVDAYYGIHSMRARENFHLSGMLIHKEIIKALAEVKKACTQANLKARHLTEDIATAIIAASTDVISGKLNNQFITDVFQGGAGTSVNMNTNEVIANRAIEILGGAKGDYNIVNPLDHVNLSQSTNDVFPTAVRIAALRLLSPASKAMANLQSVLQAKEAEFAGVIKLGRTEMQDAVPVTLGQEFSAWAQAVQRDWWRLYKIEERIKQVNLGGTAVGTGLNADRQYIYIVVDYLRDITGLPLARAENLMDLTQNCDIFVEISGLIKTAAVNMHKIASDLRLLSSGPIGGFGEISLPPLQAGSSIMPGKVNPTATEAVSQATFQIIANDQAITLAAMSGQLELNAFLPMLSHNLLQSLELLTNAANLLSEKCIKGIKANEDRCKELLESSFAMLTALSPYIGYETASELAAQVKETGTSVRQAALEMKLFTEEQLNIVLNPFEMTKPGISGLEKLGDIDDQP